MNDKFNNELNIHKSIVTSSKGKRDRKDVKEIYENPDDHIDEIKEYVKNFKNDHHTPMEIYDGIARKKRTIIVPTYREQIVHHMLVNILKPIFLKGMYEHSYGSIPKRGAHKAKKRIEKWIRTDHKNVKYCLKMDIEKFFQSIPHDILKEKLVRIIHDDEFLKVLFEVIDVVDIGLPLGFYSSQWLANWYLQGLDHYTKEDLGAAHYVRYMDDMIVFGSNKRKLHKMLEKVKEYLATLGLKLNSKTQIFRFSYAKKNPAYVEDDDIREKYIDCGRDLDFMGFRFYRNRTVLRKSIMIKMTRKARKISKKEKATIYDLRQMLSYLGWLNATDTYNVYETYIKGVVEFGKYKKRIGRYDRRLNKNVENSREQRQPEAA